MAYDIAQMSLIGYGNGQCFFVYKTNDEPATFMADDYFKNPMGPIVLDGSIIHVVEQSHGVFTLELYIEDGTYKVRTMRPVLTEPVTEDLRFPASGINPPGAVSDPTRNTTTGLLDFSASATNIIVCQGQMPHSGKEGTVIEPHIHVEALDGNAGNTRWKLEYAIASPFGVFPATFAAIEKTFEASETARKHELHTFGEIEMTGFTLSTMIKFKLSRLGGDEADTYASVSQLLEFDVHHLRDSMGSRERYVK